MKTVDYRSRSVTLTGLSKTGEHVQASTLERTFTRYSFVFYTRKHVRRGLMYHYIGIDDSDERYRRRWPRIRDLLLLRVNQDYLRQHQPERNGVYVFTRYDQDNKPYNQYMLLHEHRWFTVEQNTLPAAKMGLAYLDDHGDYGNPYFFS